MKCKIHLGYTTPHYHRVPRRICHEIVKVPPGRLSGIPHLGVLVLKGRVPGPGRADIVPAVGVPVDDHDIHASGIRPVEQALQLRDSLFVGTAEDGSNLGRYYVSAGQVSCASELPVFVDAFSKA